jgi:hypothetical protein
MKRFLVLTIKKETAIVLKNHISFGKRKGSDFQIRMRMNSSSHLNSFFFFFFCKLLYFVIIIFMSKHFIIKKQNNVSVLEAVHRF